MSNLEIVCSISLITIQCWQTGRYVFRGIGRCNRKVIYVQRAIIQIEVLKFRSCNSKLLTLNTYCHLESKSTKIKNEVMLMNIGIYENSNWFFSYLFRVGRLFDEIVFANNFSILFPIFALHEFNGTVSTLEYKFARIAFCINKRQYWIQTPSKCTSRWRSMSNVRFTHQLQHRITLAATTF